MDNEILLRSFIAAGIIGALVSVWWLTNRLVLAKASSQARTLPNFRPGRPAILYFTTPSCAPCKTMQRPAIQRLLSQTGDAVQVLEVDASSQPELASQWGVLSVPTTFILDPQGKPRHVNHGVAGLAKLQSQLANLT